MKRFVLIASAAFLLSGCTIFGVSIPPVKQTATPTPATGSIDTTEGNATASPSTMTAEETIQVKASNFTFDKKEIRVKKGQKVSITFTNEDGFHDFVIDELGVRTKQIGEGQSETVVIPTDTTGSFAYYCSVGKHRAMGMEGTLTIEE